MSGKGGENLWNEGGYSEIGPNLAKVLIHLSDNRNSFEEIKEKLNIIMGNQDTLNLKVDQLVAANTAFTEQFALIREAIAAERAQVDILVANNPNLDFSGLDAALANTESILSSSQTLDEEVGDVYTPPVTE